MRPARFQQLLDALAQAPGVTATSLAEAGHTARPYGVSVQPPNGARVWWHIIGQYTGPAEDAGQPVTGPGPGPMPLPALAAHRIPLAEMEQLLAAALVSASGAGGESEITEIDRYSARPQPPVCRARTSTAAIGAVASQTVVDVQSRICRSFAVK